MNLIKLNDISNPRKLKQTLNAKVPYIGPNGNWWIGNTDTGLGAQINNELKKVLEEFPVKDGSAPGSLIQKQGGVYSSSGVIDAECKADGINAVALGSACEAHGDASFVFGRKAKSYQIGGVAFGSCTVGNKILWEEILADIASVKAQYPIQSGETESAYISRIYPYFSQKTKNNRYSWGFAAGQGSQAIGKTSAAVGLDNRNYGENSWTSGSGNINYESGTIAFIHGDHNKNGAPEAIILGDYNEAIEKKTLESGTLTESNLPIILGASNYSESYLTVLLGQYLKGLNYRATLIGEGLTSNKPYQVILGQYNKPSDAMIVFANGLGSRGEATIPKNLLELYEDGKALTPNTDLDDNDDDGCLVPKGYLKRKLANGGGGKKYYRKKISFNNGEDVLQVDLVLITSDPTPLNLPITDFRYMVSEDYGQIKDEIETKYKNAFLEAAILGSNGAYSKSGIFYGVHFTNGELFADTITESFRLYYVNGSEVIEEI